MTGEPQANLPNSWKLTDLCEVAELNPRLDKSAHTDNPMVSFVPMPRVEAGTGAIDVGQTRSLEEVKKGYTPFREGDVLFAKITPCMENGKMAVVPPLKNGLGFGSTEFHVLRPYCEISAQYIYFFVSSESFRRDAGHNMTGAVGQRRVPTPYLADQSIPVPPAREQRRIVAKIEELFSELDKGVESLKTARAKLNVYRQAVLKHAFEGKLTAQWREENKDKLETPEQLLAHIEQEREARYQQQLQEWKAADTKWQEEQKDDYRPNKPRKLSNLVTIAAKKNEVTPKSWLSLKIDGVCDIIDGDRGPNYPKKDDYLPDGYCLFLNAKNVTKRGFVFDECQFISEEKHHSLRKGGVEIGDIIFTSRGTIGNVALHSSALDFGAIRINSGMFILRNYSPIMIGDYFTSLLISPIITKQIKRLNSGTAQPQLPIREFKQFVIPVPPIPEQEVIVRTIEAQMSSIDAIESDLARQLSSADALRQSILKKAFSGQLIPQDPHDEPASILLERIKAEKAVRSQNNTRAKRRRTTATA